MKFRALVIDPIGLGAAIGAGLLATLTLLPQARGELVYEEPDQGPVEIRQEPAPAQPGAQDGRAEDRRYMRQAITSSEKARATRQAEVVRTRVVAQPELAQPVSPPAPPAPVQYQAAPVQPQVPAPFQAAPVAPVAPVIVGEAAPAADPQAASVENLSKTELMRRERVREELRNEDAIQERLEELRLRDEKRRSDQILKGDSFLPGAQVNPPAPPAAAAAQAPGLAPLPVQDEMVVAPVTDHPGQPAAMPVAPAAQAVPAAAAPAPLNPALQSTGAQAAQESVAKSEEFDGDEEKTQIYIRPYAGLTNLNVNDAFDVKPHYSLGGALGVQSSENISFELGYTYSSYGIAVASTNPYIVQLQYLQAAQGINNPETLGLNQNVFDAGVKVSLLGAQSKIRPFIGGGGAYSKSFLNYASGYTSVLNQYGLSSQAQDYTSSAFLGFLSTGVDVKLSRQLTLGAQFKYYGVISSNENQQLNFNGFYGNPVWLGGLTSDKQAVGASLADSSFYSIEATTSFTF